MKFPKSTTIRVVLMIFLCFFIQKTQSQEYDLNTSMNTYWPAPDLTKPGYLQEVTDPTFNSKITRVSGNPGNSIPNVGGTWRDVSRHGYSVRQPWNADESIIYLDRHKDLNGNWGASLFLDGETYEVISTVSQPSANESRWHPTNPNVRLLLTDNAVKSWNVNTNQTTTLMSFSGYSNTSMGYTGNWSDDGNKIAMYANRNSDGKQVIFAVDTQNNIKYPDKDLSGVGIDYVSISPLGNYIMVNANFGQGSDRTKIYDLNGNQVGPYWSEYGRPSHFDLAIDQNGDEVAVGVDKSVNEGRVIKRRLSDGQATALTTGGWAIHSSARCINRPGWVFASTSQASGWGPYFTEIIAVKLDGTRVERVAQTRNAFGNYENQSQPCPSPSGSRVFFASDWGSGNVPVQAYVADFRDLDQSAGFNVNAGANQVICENSTEDITLSATGAQNYTWTWDGGQQNGQSITISPPSETTVYTVTGSDASGNEATDSVTVTVNTVIAADAGGDVEICEGSEVSLTASDGDSFEWNNGETTQSVVVSPEQTTTYTVTVTQNGCLSSDDVIVTVKPRPVINAGNDVDIYSGQSTILTATGEGTFEWNTGETTASITVSPSETTTYTVTNTFDGCTNSDNIVISVLDEVIITAHIGEDITICEGFYSTLTVSATGGQPPYSYLWNTGETTESITVVPNNTATYTVTVTDALSNSTTSSAEVFVNSVPIANAGEDADIFYGESATLTALGGSEYLWDNGQTTQSIVVSPTDDKNYSVEVFENGCSSTDDVWVILDVKATASEDVTICQGESTNLHASGGSTFLWSNGATTQSIEVNPNQTTTYSVTVSHGDLSDEATVQVFVNLLPNADAGEDVTIEEGQNVTLSASGGNSYIWNTGDTAQNISVSPSETTTYTVESIINGCSSFDEVTVTVVPLVDADAGDDVDSCQGETVVLTATGGQFFEWSTGETTASISVSPFETTTYSVTVSNGISSQTVDVTIITEDCIATDNLQNDYIDFNYLVYPNPSGGEVKVKLSGLDNISTIYITDILDKLIKTETIHPDNGLEILKSYNLSSLSKGMYFVTFEQSGEEAITKKLILK